MTTSRWTVLALAIAAALTAASVNYSERRITAMSDRMDEQSSWSDRRWYRTNRLMSAIDDLEWRDSLVHTWARSARRTGLEVVFRRSFSESSRAGLDSAIRAWWRERVGSQARVPVSLIFRERTSNLPSEYNGSSSILLLPPETTDGRSCVLSIPHWLIGATKSAADVPPAMREITKELDARFGPCVLAARYGPPGPALGGWLRSVRYAPAFAVSPSTRAPSLARLPATAHLGEWNIGPWSIQCASGNLTVCASMWTNDAARRDVLLPRNFVTSNAWSPASGPLGGQSGYFLANIERDIGRERFEKFWTSTGTIDDAMRAATGRTLAEQYRRAIVADIGEVYGSAWPSLTEWAVALIIAAAAIGAMATSASGRQARV
jgi:hypothetical protein